MGLFNNRMPSGKRRSSGKPRKENSGKYFEHLVAISGKHGQVVLERIHDGMISAGQGGQVKIRQKQCVDFVGSTSTGIAIFIDAKSCSEETRFPLANIKQHQLEVVVSHGVRGAIAGFLIEAVFHRSVYWLDWRWFAEGDGASIPWTDMLLVGPNNAAINWGKILTAESVQP